MWVLYVAILSPFQIRGCYCLKKKKKFFPPWIQEQNHTGSALCRHIHSFIHSLFIPLINFFGLTATDTEQVNDQPY
jgi:hypothetical protein